MSTTVKRHVEKRRKPGEVTTRALVFKGDEPVRGASGPRSQALHDPWEFVHWNTGSGILLPPYDFVGLEHIVENSSELRSNIDTLSTNIPGFGWRLQRLKHTLPPTGEEPDAYTELMISAEKELLENTLEFINYDSESLTALRKTLYRDLENTGNAFREVTRTVNGRAARWRVLPPRTMRLTVVDPDAQIVHEKQRIKRAGKSRIRIAQRQKRFRKYVQSVYQGRYSTPGTSVGSFGSNEPSMVWYKEYGDPRTMDCRTGEFVEPGSIPSKYHATEVIHDRIKVSWSPYGVPRWIGALIPLLGVRSSEEINLMTLNNNNIPSMVVLVSGGFLSEGSIARISQFVETNIQGDSNYSRFLVLEAEAAEDDIGTAENVRLSIEPLTREQHTDALFQQYDERSSAKIRQSFRIPPILLGVSQDYNRATSDTARKLADEQIFNPARIEEDFEINRFLVQEYDVLYHQFVTNTPNVTNDQDLIRVLAGAERTGGMTPRNALLMIEDIMGRELVPPQGIELDVPYSLQMAEAVKNQALPNEVGQQVTALKMDLVGRIESAIEEGHDPLDVMREVFQQAREAGLSDDDVLMALDLA